MIQQVSAVETCDTSGIGGTLPGNVLALKAIRATLENVLTEEAYKRTIPLATKLTRGIISYILTGFPAFVSRLLFNLAVEVQRIIDEKRLPWSITQLGCRAEYWFCPQRPRNGHEAASAIDADLDRYMHLYCLNRGILMTYGFCIF